jgi:hypothetical protein
MIEQGVGAQTGRPTLAPRIEPPGARALENTGESLGQLGRVLAVQADHQRILDQESARQLIAASSKEQEVAAQTDPNVTPNQWSASYTARMTPLIEKMAADPANQHIADFIQRQAPLMVRMRASDLLEAGLTATAKQQDDLANRHLKTFGNDVGSDYVVGADRSISDGPQAQAARAAAKGMIAKMYPASPDMQAAYMKALEKEATEKRAQALALDHPDLLDRFVKANNFTPEQKVGLRNMAIGGIEAPYHLATANHEALSAQTETHLDALAAAHDPGLANAAYQAKLADLITGPRYEALTHSKWRDPYATSVPGAVDKYLKEIDQNPYSHTVEEINGAPADELSPDDRRRVRAAVVGAQADAKKAVGGEYLRAQGTIRAALTPNMVLPMNSEKVRERIDSALTSMRAAKEEGQFQTVKDVQDFTKQVLATYQTGKPKKIVEPIKAAPKLMPIPPAVAPKIAAEARASGWEPGE